MSDGKIPCTVAILTHNSAASLPRALESVKDFSEIVICDGNSTDTTLDIARAAGARVIPQDPAFLYADGRIKDFAGIRTQTLDAATQPWFFFLDSDEYMSAHLSEEIRSTIVGNPAGAYWINRVYTTNGEPVDCATTYPNRSMRFFAKAGAEKFRKPVHERIKLKEGIAVSALTAPLYVPVTVTFREAMRKHRYYIGIELEGTKEISLGALLGGSFKTLGISGLYALRLVRIQLFCRGTRLPVSVELLRHVYHAQLMIAQWRARFRRKPVY